MLKPKALCPGDTVAAVSLSWGGPGVFPHRYEAGKLQLESEFDLKVEAMPNALRDPNWLERNPKARADDLHLAFSTPKYKGVFTTIGGDDSIRLLPYIDFDILKATPKVFVGYSDSTVTHFVLQKAGIVSFYGPSIMSGFAENQGIHKYLADSFREHVFLSEQVSYSFNSDGWTREHLDWGNQENQLTKRALTPSTGWRWLQGETAVEGLLFGGCVEVIDWLRGTSVWPTYGHWSGAILCLETSEEGMSAIHFKRHLRILGAVGVLERCAALLFARPGGDIPPHEFSAFDRVILEVVRDELGRSDIPIVTNLDFGHTDPMMTLPFGVTCRVDPLLKKISLLESAVT